MLYCEPSFWVIGFVIISTDLHLDKCINTEPNPHFKDLSLLDKNMFEKGAEPNCAIKANNKTYFLIFRLKCIIALRTHSKHSFAKRAIRSQQASRPAAMEKESQCSGLPSLTLSHSASPLFLHSSRFSCTPIVFQCESLHVCEFGGLTADINFTGLNERLKNVHLAS